MLSVRMANSIVYIALATAAVLYGLEAVRLEGGRGDHIVGAGAFPAAIGIGVFAVCITGLIGEFRRGPVQGVTVPNLRRLVLVTLTTGVYIAIWTQLGFFYLVTPVYLFLTFWICAEVKARHASHAVAAIGATAGMYLVFELLLGVSL